MPARPRHLLRDELTMRRIIQARRLLFLTDYDGTLMPIQREPEGAVLDAAARTLLARAGRLPGIRLGVVSGRSLERLRRFVRLPGLLYVGNHGLEMSGPGVRFTHPDARQAVPMIARVSRALRQQLRGIRGAFVEPKRLTLSVHWRAVSASDAARFRRRVWQALAPWLARRAIRVTYGKRVVEIRPPIAWDKGEAVRWLLRKPMSSREDVVYVGDDRTDEDAFRVVNRCRGVSVFVGPKRAQTSARWWLEDPGEVRAALSRLTRERWPNG